MDEAIREFLGSLAYERGLAATTRKSYAGDLAKLRAFLGDVAIRDVKTSDITAFLDSCRKEGEKDSSRARRLVAIKSFFAFAMREHIVTHDPAAVLSHPKRARRLPHVIGQEDMRRLLEAPTDASPEGLRDRAMLEMLYGCGLRASELAGLPIDAVNFDDASIRVRGKGSKVRMVPLGSMAEKALRAYLSAGGRAQLHPAPGESALFLSKRGKRISREQLWKTVKHYAEMAGLPKEVSTHWLRHSFATDLLAGDAPIRVIQELLGHADVSTTQIYTHVDSTRLAGIVKKLHPRK